MLFFRKMENKHMCGLKGCYEKFKCPVCGRKDSLYSAPDFLFDVGFQGTFVKVIRCEDHIPTTDWMEGRDPAKDGMGRGEDPEGDGILARWERKINSPGYQLPYAGLTFSEKRAMLGPKKKKDWKGGKAP